MRRLIWCLVVICAVALPGRATAITASNPGSLPGTAQDLTGLSYSEIQGSFDSTDPNDVDFFKISIANPQTFFAQTIAQAFGAPDTELFLFDSAGLGIYYNDDASFSDTLSCLPSAFANPCFAGTGGLGPTTAGIYYLAITRSANLPVDQFGNYIFSTSFDSTGIYGPDPSAGGLNPVAGWDSGAFTSPDFDLVNYDIVFSSSVPEPATWLLLVAAATFTLVAARRRLNSPQA